MEAEAGTDRGREAGPVSTSTEGVLPRAEEEEEGTTLRVDLRLARALVAWTSVVSSFGSPRSFCCALRLRSLSGSGFAIRHPRHRDLQPWTRLGARLLSVWSNGSGWLARNAGPILHATLSGSGLSRTRRRRQSLTQRDGAQVRVARRVEAYLNVTRAPALMVARSSRTVLRPRADRNRRPAPRLARATIETRPKVAAPGRTPVPQDHSTREGRVKGKASVGLFAS